MEPIRKNSKKRQAILNALRKTDEHPTAEGVYNRLKSDYPQLSLATVYRNLKMLVDGGDVRTVGEVNGQERYDARMDEHAHFVCKKCRCVFDVEISDELLNNCKEDMAGNGFVIDASDLRFIGLCPKCRTAD